MAPLFANRSRGIQPDQQALSTVQDAIRGADTSDSRFAQAERIDDESSPMR